MTQDELKVTLMQNRFKGPLEVRSLINDSYEASGNLNVPALRQDLSLLEGKYNSGAELERKLTQVNLMHVYPTQLIEDKIFGKVWEVIGKQLVYDIRKQARPWALTKARLQPCPKTGKTIITELSREESQKSLKALEEMSDIDLLIEYMADHT